jgi:hypothetical protein
MSEDNDIVTQLLDAADGIDALTRSALQVLLRRAALDIDTLRKLVDIRDEVWLESVPTEGSA